MKFVKISFLTVLVVIVSAFIFCDVSGPKEGDSIQQIKPPLTPEKRMETRNKIDKEINEINKAVMDHFAKDMWEEMLDDYERMEENGGGVVISLADEPVAVGALGIRDYWRRLKDADPNLKMVIVRKCLVYSDYANKDLSVHKDELDMQVVENTDIHIIKKNGNNTYGGRGERRHRRECDW